MNVQDNQKVCRFLDAVCAGIRSREVHADIRLELEAHLAEQVECELAQGVREEEAIDTALKYMGDPVMIGGSLDKIHRPRLEWGLVALLGGFVAIALLTMFSLEGFVPAWIGPLVPQTALAALLGGSIALGIYFIDYRQVTRAAPWLFGLVLILLAAARIQTVARPFVGVSPYLLVVAAAVLLRKYNSPRPVNLLVIIGVICLPTILLIGVPSFTAALIYLVASCAMLLSTRPNKRSVAIVAGAILLGLMLVSFSVPHHVWARWHAFLNPVADFAGSDYIQMRLLEAVQLGGPFGQRAAATLDALPEFHTDFVLTYIIYRYGWVPGTALILLAGLFVVRLIYTCQAIREPLGRTIAIGLTTLMALHFIISIIVSVGKAPILSASFPFISYGRLHLMVELMVVGMVLSIYRVKDMISYCSSPMRQV